MFKWNYVTLFWCFLLAFTACQSQPTPTPTSVAQLPTATATHTATSPAVPPTAIPTITNTPDRVATALARHPTNTPTPSPFPTVPPFEFAPFTATIIGTYPAPLLPLVDHRDGSILQIAAEDNFVYFNVGVRLVKMDVNRPGSPLATAGPLSLLPQEMIALNSIVYLLFPDQTIVAYSVMDSWQPIAQFTAASPVLRFFVHDQQLYLHLETDSGEELVWLSPTLETEQTLALPPHTLTHDLPWLYQLQFTNDDLTHVAQADLTEQPFTFTPLLPFPDGSNYNSLFTINNLLYIPTAYPFDEQVFVYQIQNNSLVKIAEEELSLAEISTRQGNLLADEFNFGDAGSCTGHFTVWDVSTPAAPQEVDSYGSYTIADVWLESPLAYGSDASNLVQLNTAQNTEAILWQSTGEVNQLAYTDGRVWMMNEACDTGGRLYEYALLEDNHLTQQGSLEAYGFLFAGPNAVYYQPTQTYGLTVVLPGRPLNPIVIDKFFYNIAFFFNQYVLATRYGDSFELAIYDTTNPLKWELVSQMTDISAGYVVFDGRFVYTGSKDKELSIIDVTNVTNPVITTTFPLPSPGSLKAAGNGFLYVTFYNQEEAQLFVYDVQNPTNPFLLTTFTLPEPIHTMKLDGTTGYILGDDLWVYDLTNPAAPQLIATYPTPGRASDLLITDTAVYLADGDAGILVFAKPTQE